MIEQHQADRERTVFQVERGQDVVEPIAPDEAEVGRYDVATAGERGEMADLAQSIRCGERTVEIVNTRSGKKVAPRTPILLALEVGQGIEYLVQASARGIGDEARRIDLCQPPIVPAQLAAHAHG